MIVKTSAATVALWMKAAKKNSLVSHKQTPYRRGADSQHLVNRVATRINKGVAVLLKDGNPFVYTP